MMSEVKNFIVKGIIWIKRKYNDIKKAICDMYSMVKNETKKEIVQNIKKEEVHADVSNEELKEIIVRKIVDFAFNFILNLISKATEFFSDDRTLDKIVYAILK